MEHLTLALPAMYGDHHVVEVRQLLSALPGVTAVTASSAWQRVTVAFDGAQIGADDIAQALLARGYATGPQAETANVPPASARTKAGTSFGEAPGAVQQFVESVPAWVAAPVPCPGFEVRHPGSVHPADR